MSMLGCMFGCMRKSQDFVEKIGANPQNADGTIAGEDTDKGVTAVHTYFIDTMALAGVAASVCTFVFTEGYLVSIASAGLLAYAPLSGWQKHKLASLGGMRGQQNALRANVNSLQVENNQLHSSIDQLEGSVDDLQEVEGQLEQIAVKARTNVNRLQTIVQENKRIIQAINQNLAAQITQDLIEVVLNSDNDADGMIGPRELDMVVLRMDNMPGFNFDEKNFRKAIGGRTHVGMKEIMNIIRNLDDPNIPEDENIFHMDPKQLKNK